MAFELLPSSRLPLALVSAANRLFKVDESEDLLRKGPDCPASTQSLLDELNFGDFHRSRGLPRRFRLRARWWLSPTTLMESSMESPVLELLTRVRPVRPHSDQPYAQQPA